jgi:hypothetical protein
MTVPMKAADGDIMEKVVIQGDLSKLLPTDRVRYYNEVCHSLGLNPLTRPFDYILLNGKLQLYATRAATDQLRKINAVSLHILSREVVDDILTVRVRAKTPDDRVDEDSGSVPFPPTLKGEFRANMEMKAVTKAKRRVTLSICGLGWLDEIEIDSIPDSAKGELPEDTRQIPKHDPDGVILDDEIPEFDNPPPSHPAEKAGAPPHQDQAPSGASAESLTDRLMRFDHALKVAAEDGTDALRQAYKQIPKEDRHTLDAALNARHLPRAKQVDASKEL